MAGDHTPDARSAALGVELPEVPAPAAAYEISRAGGGLVFISGQLPKADGQLLATGKLGEDLDTDTGVELARRAGLYVLAVARAAADGDLSRVRMVKLTVFVASTATFTEQHLVANGASELMVEVLGEDGRHARAAVGVPCLPLDSPVEVEAMIEVRAV